jgi:hypothetical protein
MTNVECLQYDVLYTDVEAFLCVHKPRQHCVYYFEGIGALHTALAHPSMLLDVACVSMQLKQFSAPVRSSKAWKAAAEDATNTTTFAALGLAPSYINLDGSILAYGNYIFVTDHAHMQ